MKTAFFFLGRPPPEKTLFRGLPCHFARRSSLVWFSLGAFAFSLPGLPEPSETWPLNPHSPFFQFFPPFPEAYGGAGLIPLFLFSHLPWPADSWLVQIFPFPGRQPICSSRGPSTTVGLIPFLTYCGCRPFFFLSLHLCESRDISCCTFSFFFGSHCLSLVTECYPFFSGVFLPRLYILLTSVTFESRPASDLYFCSISATVPSPLVPPWLRRTLRCPLFHPRCPRRFFLDFYVPSSSLYSPTYFPLACYPPLWLWRRVGLSLNAYSTSFAPNPAFSVF